MPVLYVVGTPIGNLEDITLRALRILKEAPLIAAEDTRKTKILLNRYEIRARLTSYHEHSSADKLAYLLEWLLTQDLALVSEAGMPGLSDPGYELIVGAIKQGTRVVPIPGASVIVTALAASGLSTTQFTYLGFLPRKKGEQLALLKSISTEPRTLVVLEAPHRLQSTLQNLLDVLGDRRIVVAREMTKIHEEMYRCTISEAKEHFTVPRGEFTLVIEGFEGEPQPVMKEDVRHDMSKLYRAGLPAREAVSRLAERTGLSRKELYRLWLEIKDAEEGG